MADTAITLQKTRPLVVSGTLEAVLDKEIPGDREIPETILVTTKGEPLQMPDSTSDSRIDNNVMRHEYRTLSEEEKRQMKALKDMGLEFFEFCDMLGQSRELSLAKAKIEEAVMWAVKHLTK